MKDFYDVMFRRKSVRKFEGPALTESEIAEIKAEIGELLPLNDDIRVKFMLVPREETTAKFGEYCLLMYSEQKPDWLINAGYMLEQMDLYLESRDIGVCWYGLARPQEKEVDGLTYVIMLAFGRGEELRSDVSEFDRSALDAIWTGEFDGDVTEAVRLAPSACNTQPWRITSGGGKLKVCRDPNVTSFLRGDRLTYFNSIDMGICLCFLEGAMHHKGIAFSRTLLSGAETENGLLETAEYTID